MSDINDMPCWEIMDCPDDCDCVARQNPSRYCWDIALELEQIQDVYGICCDCIVYQVKSGSSLLDKEELLTIIRSRNVSGRKQPKCATFIATLRSSCTDQCPVRSYKYL